MKHKIETYSGISFDLNNPRIRDITIGDIGHALSNLCRFNGHCNRFYSVAEHCVEGSYLASPDVALFFLLHDVSEAYMGDVVTPLKSMLPLYKEKEDHLLRMIFDKFIPIPYTNEIEKEIKIIDERMLEIEKQFLFDDVYLTKSKHCVFDKKEYYNRYIELKANYKKGINYE